MAMVYSRILSGVRLMNSARYKIYRGLLIVFAIGTLQADVDSENMDSSKRITAGHTYRLAANNIINAASDTASNLWELAKNASSEGITLVKDTRAYNATLDAFGSLQELVKDSFYSVPEPYSGALKGAGYGLVSSAGLTALLTVAGYGALRLAVASGAIAPQLLGMIFASHGGEGALIKKMASILVPAGIAVGTITGGLLSAYDLLEKAKADAAEGNLTDTQAQTVIEEVHNLLAVADQAAETLSAAEEPEAGTLE
jgi:hypothetical protein